MSIMLTKYAQTHSEFGQIVKHLIIHYYLDMSGIGQVMCLGSQLCDNLTRRETVDHDWRCL